MAGPGARAAATSSWGSFCQLRTAQRPGRPLAPLNAGSYQGLAEAGYFDGRNVRLLFQWADYHYDRLPALAADLVDKRSQLFLAGAPTGVPMAAKAATDTIPIVFVTNS